MLSMIKLKNIKPLEIKKFFGRFLAFFLISAGIIAGTVLVDQFGPPPVQYTDDQFDFGPYIPSNYNETEYPVLLDQHSHTIHSDGVLTPEQNILWHIAHGFNAMILTDHDNIEGAKIAQKIAREKYNDTIKVIIGQEWTTSRIHMNLLGISDLVPKPIGAPTDNDIKAAINNTHAQGGVVTVNHIPWSLRQGMNHPNQTDLIDWGIDYIEVINGDEFDIVSNRDYNATSVGKIAGTDMHNPKDVNAWTGLSAAEFTEEAIMDALRNKNTTLIYESLEGDTVTSGSVDYSGEPSDNPAYLAVEPIAIIGNTFEQIYNGGTMTIVLAVLYLMGAFFAAELLRVAKRRYWHHINNRKIKKKELVE